jgi:hypothetical protein
MIRRARRVILLATTRYPDAARIENRSLVVKQRPGAEDLDSSMRADASIDALAASVRSLRAWLIVFYFLFSAGILAALARGFGWI